MFPTLDELCIHVGNLDRTGTVTSCVTRVETRGELHPDPDPSYAARGVVCADVVIIRHVWLGEFLAPSADELAARYACPVELLPEPLTAETIPRCDAPPLAGPWRGIDPATIEETP